MGWSDRTLTSLVALCDEPLDREGRADRLARLLAEPDRTVALRWRHGSEWVLLASAGEQASAMRMPEPESLLAAPTGAPSLLLDLGAEELPGGPWRTLMTAVGLRSALLLPLWDDSLGRGLAAVYDRHADGFADDPPERRELMAHLASHVLRATPVADNGNDTDADEPYRQAIRLLHAHRDAEEAGQRAAEEIQRLFRCRAALVARCDDSVHGFDVHMPLERYRFDAADAGQLRQVALSRQATEEPPSRDPSDRVAALLIAAGIERAAFEPLVFDGRLFGVMLLGFDHPGSMTPGAWRMLRRFAFHVSLSMRDARLLRDQEQALARLRQAQSEATEGAKFRALAQMAGGVAHEFNNALGGILGRAQMLQRQTTDHRIQKGLRTIFEIGWRAAETVRRLQDFTRERSEEDLEAISVAALWDRLVEAARQQQADLMKSAAARYHVELDHGSLEGSLLANLDELVEAISNVLVNAFEATPGGGVVTLHADVNDDHLHLTVVDRGRGMSSEEQQSIFDPFYSTKAETGVGLGLSVTYGIVTRHRGEILVDSTPTRGTTVSIVLPLNAPTTEIVEAAPLKVLVIDDEAALCDVLAELFGSAGHDVHTCAGGREGIERFQSIPYDLVCTDLRTEDVSGWEVIRAVKESGRGTPVMLLTGFRDQLRPEQIEQSGVDAVLGKPFTLQQVMEAADALLHRA